MSHKHSGFYLLSLFNCVCCICGGGVGSSLGISWHGYASEPRSYQRWNIMCWMVLVDTLPASWMPDISGVNAELGDECLDLLFGWSYLSSPFCLIRCSSLFIFQLFYIFEVGFVWWTGKWAKCTSCTSKKKKKKLQKKYKKTGVILLLVSAALWVMSDWLIGTWAKTVMWRWSKFGVWNLMVPCIMAHHQPHETSHHRGPSQWLQLPGRESAASYSRRSSFSSFFFQVVFFSIYLHFVHLVRYQWNCAVRGHSFDSFALLFVVFFFINMLLFIVTDFNVIYGLPALYSFFPAFSAAVMMSVSPLCDQ